MSHSVLLLYSTQEGPNENRVDTLFEKSGSQGESWHTTQVPVPWRSKKSGGTTFSNLMIVATRVPNTHGEIAISSIQFEEGKCKEKGEF